jgi:hypothetical protein
MDEIIAQDFRSIATDRIDDIFVGLDPRRRNITIRGSMKDVSELIDCETLPLTMISPVEAWTMRANERGNPPSSLIVRIATLYEYWNLPVCVER